MRRSVCVRGSPRAVLSRRRAIVRARSDVDLSPRLLDAAARSVARRVQAGGAAVGEDDFAGLMQEYLDAHPSPDPAYRDDWLRLAGVSARASIARERRCLADLAAFEWAEVEALLAADPPEITIGFDVPSAVFPACTFEMVPALRVLAFVTDPLTELGGAPSPTTFAVWRRGFSVQHRRLEPDEHQAATAALAGRPWPRCASRSAARSDSAGARIGGHSQLAVWRLGQSHHSAYRDHARVTRAAGVEARSGGCVSRRLRGEPEPPPVATEPGPLMRPGLELLGFRLPLSGWPSPPSRLGRGRNHLRKVRRPGSPRESKASRSRLRDARGIEVRLLTNAAGNFYTAEPLEGPIDVTLERAGRTIKMPTPAPAGSCNFCHAQPPIPEGPAGRIYAP